MSLFRSPSRSVSGRLGIGRVGIVSVVVAGVLLAGSAAVAQAAPSFGVKRFFAANCRVEFESCGKTKSPENEHQAIEEGAFRQAGGYVPYGVTQFEMNTVEAAPGLEVPVGDVQNVRVDVAPGVVTNPEAVPRCSVSGFTSTEVEPGIFLAPECRERSIIGKNEVVTVLPTEAGLVDAPLSGNVYNLEQPNGLGSYYGVALQVGEVEVLPGVLVGLYVHTFIEGNVEWSTDYHDYFVIKNIAPGLISSRLTFFGNQEHGELGAPAVPAGFVRNPTSCNGRGPATTTTLHVESSEHQSETRPYEGLVGAEECGLVPFDPLFTLGSETSASDAADGITTEATAPHPPAPGPDSSDLKNATVTLPPGMTMNPSAAAGLEGCEPGQMGAGVHNPIAFEIAPLFHVSCPSRSKIGTVTLEVPTLPPGSLTGSIYLGRPAGGRAIEGPPYTIYVATESSRFGVLVRLEGTIEPNPATGQLTTRFSNLPGAPFNNPEAPFNHISLHFNGGPFAPIANPLACGTANAQAVFTPFANPATTVLSASPFTTVGCPGFAPTQSTSAIPNTAGAESNFTFTLVRPQGQQYIQQMSTTLPPGVVAKIPSVTPCAEAQANAGTCSEASLIGAVRVTAGSGEPYPFMGKVYLTEHYEGAPYGLSVVVPTAAGPFNFGNTVTRAKIEINPTSARVTVAVVKSFVQGATTSGVPTIVGGIPIRMRELTVSINRPNYILNPTNCSEFQTETALTSTLGTTYTAKSPFKVEGCSSLPFKPSFSASTSSHTSRANGASLSVKITQNPGPEANIRSVVTTLPLQLPSRLSTLNRACLLATFNANPAACPAASKVGSASVVTPTLPNKMTGTAYIVSRGAEFPDLELVLEGDGVKIILDGQTHIKKGITTTTFASNPDVPISSFSLNLPMASNSLLAANGTFCRVPLYMPTTITGQNGKVFTQKTKISVSGCLPITHRVRGHHVTISARIPQGGRVRFSGFDLGIITRFPRHAKTVTVNLPLTPSGLFKLRRDHKLNSTVRVGFIPFLRGGAPFVTYANVTFR
jgi:hypothetical protein